MKEIRYAVLGAGRQGCAAAYDLAKFGNASEILLADRNVAAAEQAAALVNALTGNTLARAVAVDATDTLAVWQLLVGVNGMLSAMHYRLNPMLTKIAVESGCHMVDLGGNTRFVFAQQEYDRAAQASGVTVIPDCGMAPGLNVSLACYALEKLAHTRSVVIYCGGIPERPKPPLGYHFPFAVSGLVNECSGEADIIIGGEVRQISALFTVEKAVIPSIGTLEATHTSGGLSTAPWTLNDRYPLLETLEYKTLRYAGHWKMLQMLAKEGRLASALEAFEHAEHTDPHDPEDLGIVSVHANGSNAEGRQVKMIVEVVDRYDHDTCFTAMQRLTGFHASVALIAAVEQRFAPGVLSVESLDPNLFITELARRGIVVEETLAVYA